MVNNQNTDKYPPVGGVVDGDNNNDGADTDKYPPVVGADGSRKADGGGSQQSEVGSANTGHGGEKVKNDTFGVGLPPAVEKVAGWPSLFVRNLEPSKGISIGFNSER